MHALLQWIGGAGYLLNKIFLSFSERSRKKGDARMYQKWRVLSWSVYFVGLPAWVLIFIGERNWIAAGVEASGAPSIILGLITALRGDPKKTPRWLNRLALVFIPLGFAWSIHDFGGLTTITQWLETALVIGFLVGTYLLAKERASGYLWYVLMHVTCAWLMVIEGYPWLFWQQVVSLAFIIDAYRVQRKSRKQ